MELSVLKAAVFLCFSKKAWTLLQNVERDWFAPLMGSLLTFNQPEHTTSSSLQWNFFVLFDPFVLRLGCTSTWTSWTSEGRSWILECLVWSESWGRPNQQHHHHLHLEECLSRIHLLPFQWVYKKKRKNTNKKNTICNNWVRVAFSFSLSQGP